MPGCGPPTSTASDADRPRRRWPRISSPISASPTCASPRPRRSAAPARSRRCNARVAVDRRRALPACAAAARPHRLTGGRIGTRMHQMPQFRTVGEFEGRSAPRPGAVLRADGAAAHGAVRHHQPAAGGDRGHHAAARHPQRQCDDDTPDDDRGSPGLPDDRRSAAAAGLLAWKATAPPRWWSARPDRARDLRRPRVLVTGSPRAIRTARAPSPSGRT